MIHLAEDDDHLQRSLAQDFEQDFSELLAVNKNDGLSHGTHLEDVLDEFWLLLLVALIHELLDVGELKQLFLDVDLLGFFDYL